MKDYSTKNIINIALAGHASVGKTTLAEAMVYNSGAIHKMGSIDSGTTVSDYREYEISNQHSISLSLLSFASNSGVHPRCFSEKCPLLLLKL